ncbi:MAG: DUF4407 domain-containing protein [Saprospiraceae bacterium]|jgi:hypothetical protein|nr:DUF4407 domain-containing protein [Saprospiraceae bacterium]MBK9583117.1 DUF4407 domain-containing protein [Saprospiraceae bacterium]MBK9744189.1 DUF4407 domain-containing protein [Saprospiraceae bacterium]MBP9055617.1 DUF4407 domain-containing protein [Saprospiraceae bacterium]HQV67129.1 DUF4407 domain-containing protein [Saprospiraceae bacterium]
MNSVSSFFIFCSGAVNSVLKRCPTDYIKYQGIGATILFTGIFSALSAGYALYTVFESYVVSTIFAIIWGMMIFNLDRYIVSGMRKKSNFLKELAMAAPRIILAVFIGIVIATPLELKLFESEINAEIGMMQQETYRQQDDLLKKRYEADTKVINDEITLLRNKLSKFDQERTARLSEALAEADGTGGSKIRAMGAIYKAKAKASDKAEQDYQLAYAEINPKLEQELAKLEVIESKRNAEMETLSRASLTGFASRLKALHRLSSADDAIRIAGIFISILFLIIECAPILVKLISERTPYDQRIDTLETEYHLANLKQTTIAKLATDSQLTFENKTAGFRVTEMINAENEVFAHALRKEKEDLMSRNEGWFTMLKKRRIFDF